MSQVNLFLWCPAVVTMDDALDRARHRVLTRTPRSTFTSQELFRGMLVQHRDKRAANASILRLLQGEGLIAPCGQVMERRASGKRGYTTLWRVVA